MVSELKGGLGGVRRQPAPAKMKKADGTLVEKVKAAGVEVNDADKAAFVAASQPIYDAFAQQVPGGADLVSKAQVLAK